MKKNLLTFRLFAVLLAFVLVSTLANAQTRTASVNGNWNNIATWGGATVPTSANDVVINNGITVTVTADAEALSVTFRSASGTLTVNSTFKLDVSTSITLENIVAGNTGATLAGAGTINCASLKVGGVVTAGFTTDRTVTLTSTSSALNISGDLTVRSEDETSNQSNATFIHTSGSASVSGTVVIDAENDGLGSGSSSATYNMNGGGAETGTLVLSGATPFSTPGTGTVVFDANGGSATVNYSGAAQTVRATTYRNLSLSGSDVKTLTGVTTINATLTMSGSVSATTASAMTADDLILNGTSSLTTGNILAIVDDMTIANGASLNIEGFNFSVAGNSTIDGTLNSNSASGTKTFDNITIGTTGLFNSAVNEDYSLTGSLAVNGSGSLTSGTGTWTFSGSSTLNGTGAVTITAANFTTDYSNTGNYTFSNMTVTGGTSDFTNNGTITITSTLAGTGEFIQGAGDRLNFSGATMAITTFTASGADNTVNYDGAAQTIRGVSYQNLILSGSTTKTLGAATTVNDTLSMRGTAALALGAFALTYSGTATLEFAGSVAQTSTDIEFKSTGGPRNLKINNSNGVTLHAARTIAGVLILTNGVLYTDAVKVLNLADGATTSNSSDNSFVDGPLSKTGNDAFTFPVGKTGAGLRTIGISAPSSTSSIFTAEFVRNDPHTLSSAFAGLAEVSYCEYWNLANTGTASSASVILSWAAASNCGGSFYVGNTNTLRIARLNAGTWANEGRLSTTGSLSAGTITSGAAVSAFGTSFVLATSANDNALPVMFNDVKAYQKNSGVQIDWTNLTERDLVSYIVERSVNGVNFTAINQQSPKSNNNDKQSYSAFDATPLSGSNFYRIKVLEISGKVIYSKVIRVEMDKATQGFSIYPNPVKGNLVSVSIKTKQGNYAVKVLNTSGQEIYSLRIIHQGGSLTQTVELPASIKPGVYNMLISGDNYREAKMFVVQ